MRARATIQSEETARALGVDTERTYMTTFAIGSGLAGLTGALYAPTITMVPTLGGSFLVEAFVAVVVGGSSVVLGTLLAGGLLGSINALFSNLVGTFFGRIALLVTAIVMLRFLPNGITGYLEHLRTKRQEGA
jgi:branched-chain amino acid transport system permease protein